MVNNIIYIISIVLFLGERTENICGLLSFIMLEISFVGIIIMVMQIVNKKSKKNSFLKEVKKWW